MLFYSEWYRLKLPRRIYSPGFYKTDLIYGKVDRLFVNFGDLGEGL